MMMSQQQMMPQQQPLKRQKLYEDQPLVPPTQPDDYVPLY